MDFVDLCFLEYLGALFISKEGMKPENLGWVYCAFTIENNTELVMNFLEFLEKYQFYPKENKNLNE